MTRKIADLGGGYRSAVAPELDNYPSSVVSLPRAEPHAPPLSA